MNYQQEEQLIAKYLPMATDILIKNAVDVSKQVKQQPLANQLASLVNCDPEIALLTIAKAVRIERGKLVKERNMYKKVDLNTKTFAEKDLYLFNWLPMNYDEDLTTIEILLEAGGFLPITEENINEAIEYCTKQLEKQLWQRNTKKLTGMPQD